MCFVEHKLRINSRTTDGILVSTARISILDWSMFAQPKMDLSLSCWEIFCVLLVSKHKRRDLHPLCVSCCNPHFPPFPAFFTIWLIKNIAIVKDKKQRKCKNVSLGRLPKFLLSIYLFSVCCENLNLIYFLQFAVFASGKHLCQPYWQTACSEVLSLEFRFVFEGENQVSSFAV